MLSLPVAVLLLLLAGLSLFGAFQKVFGSDVPVNYTFAEVVAARDWCASLLAPRRPTLSFCAPQAPRHPRLPCRTAQRRARLCPLLT